MNKNPRLGFIWLVMAGMIIISNGFGQENTVSIQKSFKNEKTLDSVYVFGCYQQDFELFLSEPAITYQWQRNGRDIPGATDEAYIIENAGYSDEAVYSCYGKRFAGDTIIKYESDLAVFRIKRIDYEKDVKAPSCPLIQDGYIGYRAGDGTHALEYAWENGSTAKYIDNLNAGHYIVEITDPLLECKEKDTTTITFEDRVCIEIPNAFSPNDDGVNDSWEIKRLHELYPKAEVIVLNNWGNTVFASKGYREPWDGHTPDGAPVPLTTFYYIIELNDGFGSVDKGQITIVR